MSRRSRATRLWAVYGTVALACAGVAMALVLTSDHEDHPVATVFVGEVLGLSFVAAGLLGASRRPQNPTGRLLAFVGFMFFVGALGEANGSVAFTIGDALGAIWIAAFVHLLVAYPTGTVARGFDRRLVATAYGVALAYPVASLLAARRQSGCAKCPESAIFVSDSHGAATAVEIVGSVSAAAVMVATIVLLVRRWRGASAAYRHSMRHVLVTGAVAVGLFALDLGLEPVLPHAVELVLASAAAAAFVCVPFAFAFGLLRSRFAGAAVGRLVADLGPAPAPGRLRDELRAVLGDPTLDLAYWVRDPGAYVDFEGRPFDPDVHAAATIVDGETGRIAVLAHDPALLEERELLDAVVAAARLALENERLHAELRARLVELERERDFASILLNNAPAFLCVVDSDGRIVRFNQTLEEATPVTNAAVQDRFFWDVFAVYDEADEVRASFALAAVAGRSEPHEQTLAAADGSRRTVLWSEIVIPDEVGQMRYLLASGLDVTERKWQEQTEEALRRVATLVAAGPSESELFATVAEEVGRLFGAQSASTLRWDGDTVRVLGSWNAAGETVMQAGRVYEWGGDTVSARVVQTGVPARADSRAELETDTARRRWRELGIHATIGAPVVVDGRVWGIIIAARTHDDDPFPAGAERRLADFAALVSQAIANAEARREVAALAEEQAALRRVATLVAAGRSEAEVLQAVTREAGVLFGADGVNLVRWEGVLDEVIVIGSWSGGRDPIPPRSPYHPGPSGVTIRMLETGLPARGDESSPELGPRCVIAAPVIVNAILWGALVAMRGTDDPFPPGSEIRLRSFSDLIAQAIANARAQEELRASRARLVSTADEARQKLERNLHDGAQQRLVAVSISLRLALAKLSVLGGGVEESRSLLAAAADELTHAIDELRELARGIHPAILTDRGLGPALEALAGRAPLPVEVDHALEERLPPPVEAAAYYVVSESLANVAKYARASAVHVRVYRRHGVARVEVEDDGVGGADPGAGSGLRGLADRVEALDGRLGVDSAPDEGTRVWAEIPV